MENDWVLGSIWLGATAVAFLLIYLLHRLRKKCIYNNEKRRNSMNFKIQCLMLAVIGLYIIGCVCLFNQYLAGNKIVAVAILATVATWIFQDPIKSVVAYIHLHNNDMIHIDDWISCQKAGVDGMVMDITLTSVKIRNWDTTVSSVPTYQLQDEHLQNWQVMLDKKTQGRRMLKDFVIDLSTVRPMAAEELAGINASLSAIGEKPIDAKSGDMPALNLHLFRKYMHAWLVTHANIHHDISLEPRMLVRLLEPTPQGIPLQIYTYLRHTSLEKFELLQSVIIEKTLMIMDCFGLRLYQRPSSADFHNTDILCENV